MKVHFVIVVGASRIAETNHDVCLVGVAGLGGVIVSSVVGMMVGFNYSSNHGHPSIGSFTFLVR